ncbi:hypothetical protein [Stenotrophomonas sp. S39]|uniref:hypothetical protein n=1 Tax=Stenotrophomonas sp. S39 TaxID=2767451 RepID=UPI00190B9EF7|nr:hypothetical protein [Stenotrophomonas sp. S39]MBK0053013.1 hypothetical protein [Stenotrophomonas sp. S39]
MSNVVSEIEKQLADAIKHQEALQEKLLKERTKEAGKFFEILTGGLTKYLDVLTNDQRSQIARMVGFVHTKNKAHGNRNARGGAPTHKLANTQASQFHYRGRGRKPQVLVDFEASPEGQELLKAGKPTHIAL